jgi:hypothetical protein
LLASPWAALGPRRAATGRRATPPPRRRERPGGRGRAWRPSGRAARHRGREQVAVAVKRERDRRMLGPHIDLLGIRAGGDPQRDRRHHHRLRGRTGRCPRPPGRPPPRDRTQVERKRRQHARPLHTPDLNGPFHTSYLRPVGRRMLRLDPVPGAAVGHVLLPPGCDLGHGAGPTLDTNLGPGMRQVQRGGS